MRGLLPSRIFVTKHQTNDQTSCRISRWWPVVFKRQFRYSQPQSIILNISERVYVLGSIQDTPNTISSYRKLGDRLVFDHNVFDHNVFDHKHKFLLKSQFSFCRFCRFSAASFFYDVMEKISIYSFICWHSISCDIL